MSAGAGPRVCVVRGVGGVAGGGAGPVGRELGDGRGRTAAPTSGAGAPGGRPAPGVPLRAVLDVPGPSAEPEYEARCVSGEEADCGARSGPRLAPAEVEEWQRRHTQETRHTRYRRSFVDYAVLERQ
ncbi:DUF7848 domain-containing protein [Streptomyces sp. KR55]|uniref:DUF7848 domain-containing protein n=1 Tax=Streptomyces sp. KR55 TaxID=3457425 RepID=UPI003FD2A868